MFLSPQAQAKVAQMSGVSRSINALALPSVSVEDLSRMVSKCPNFLESEFEFEE